MPNSFDVGRKSVNHNHKSRWIFQAAVQAEEVCLTDEKLQPGANSHQNNAQTYVSVDIDINNGEAFFNKNK